jgi:hypothetical protein
VLRDKTEEPNRHPERSEGSSVFSSSDNSQSKKILHCVQDDVLTAFDRECENLNGIKIARAAMEVAGRLPIGFAHNHKKLYCGEAQ